MQQISSYTHTTAAPAMQTTGAMHSAGPRSLHCTLSTRSPSRTCPRQPPCFPLRGRTGQAVQRSWPVHGGSGPSARPRCSRAYPAMSSERCSGEHERTRMTRATGWATGSWR
eukprot:357218-Chlamydomonas_euryale.AAC.8